ncbi:MAG: sulfatase [Armatimonadetes bacterium]|nr:sulfatase [Armatimonadota bacterium]
MNVIVILCDTLRRDHCSPYTGGKPLHECWSQEAPPWSVPTPNMERLAERGTVFENAYCGSSPCMPARRDIYTGRLEFLERGWGPLEEEDLDLPRQVSGPPNMSIRWMQENGLPVSYLVSDHFHLWEQGSGNYHMGYSGFQFIRGQEADGLYTDPVEFDCPPNDRMGKCERHWRNVHFLRQSEEDWFAMRTFSTAADWLRRNHSHQNFYLHIDCFTPHEPLDPPEDLVKLFDPEGYSRFPAFNWPYAKWRDHMTSEEFQNSRARYAANVVLVDRALGKVLDAMDELNLWDDTLVIFTTDHGTFNGDHGRIGKLQTHQFDAVAHIPFIAAHPGGCGAWRRQLVQLVDIYPTVIEAVGRPVPDFPDNKPLNGISLFPVLQDPCAKTRDFALMGMFGQSVSITDGQWILHQSPVPENQPLYWHGYHLARFIPYGLGTYQNGRREVHDCPPWSDPTWLSDKASDLNELVNRCDDQPAPVRQMQQILRETLAKLKAPPEQVTRLGLDR